MTLPPRQPGRVVDPTKEQVAQMIARLALGPDKEPDWGKLYEAVVQLDFRDYPESFAPVVSEAGWLHSVAEAFKARFRRNDEPLFVEALVAYYKREHDKLPTAHERIQYPQLLNRMTSSPALIPALVRGLDTASSIPIYSGCLVALEHFQSERVAQALIERARTAEDRVRPGDDVSRRGLLHYTITTFRNPELLPYLERELAQEKDASLAQQIRAAITGTKQGWPRNLQPEHWKQLKEPRAQSSVLMCPCPGRWTTSGIMGRCLSS